MNRNGVAASFYQYSYDELENLCGGANLLFNWHYKKNQRAICTHHNLSKKTRTFLQSLSFEVPTIATVHQSADKTVKFLFRMNDGLTVESVLIPFQGKYTICVSSQVGCAMKCSFCYTGTQGLARHLKTEEIIGQFIEAKRWLTEHRPDDDRIQNIVYMGQGEPLHNFDAVKKSAEIFISQHGLSVADHKITISTSGYMPGLQRWKAEMPDVNIALSLHSTDNEKRSQLIPINKKYPLAQVLELIDTIPRGAKRFVTYEYLLIHGFNDSAADAEALGSLLEGRKAYINLIPFNPFPGTEYGRPEIQQVQDFKAKLDRFRIPTLIRTTKGDQILAACGQLNTANTARPRTVN